MILKVSRSRQYDSKEGNSKSSTKKRPTIQASISKDATFLGGPIHTRSNFLCPYLLPSLRHQIIFKRVTASESASRGLSRRPCIFE